MLRCYIKKSLLVASVVIVRTFLAHFINMFGRRRSVCHLVVIMVYLGSPRLAHRRLRYSPLCPPEAPPGGQSGCHLVARQPLPAPTIYQSFSQIGPQTVEKIHFLHSTSATWWQPMIYLTINKSFSHYLLVIILLFRLLAASCILPALRGPGRRG